jgi:very-short-patch-repair endonuclease
LVHFGVVLFGEENAMRGGLTRRAQVLRRDMTPPERILWRGLRGERLGVAFRRQHPVAPYVLDFACVALRVVTCP